MPHALRRMGSRSAAVAVIAMLVALLLPTGAASAASSVTLISMKDVATSSGRVLVGEVRNDGATVVESVRLDFEFLDSAGRLLSTDFTFAYVDRLAPGVKSPFRNSFTPPAGYSTTRTRVSASEATGAANYGFTTRVTNDVADDIGRRIVGTVTNNGASAGYVQVVATFYDASGAANNADLTFVDTDNFEERVEAGETVAFELRVLGDLPTDGAYELLTESTLPGEPSPAASRPSPSR